MKKMTTINVDCIIDSTAKEYAAIKFYENITVMSLLFKSLLLTAILHILTVA